MYIPHSSQTFCAIPKRVKHQQLEKAGAPSLQYLYPRPRPPPPLSHSFLDPLCITYCIDLAPTSSHNKDPKLIAVRG